MPYFGGRHSRRSSSLPGQKLSWDQRRICPRSFHSACAERASDLGQERRFLLMSLCLFLQGDLFRDRQSVVYSDAEIADSALKFVLAQEQLARANVSRLIVDLCGFRTSYRMRFVALAPRLHVALVGERTDTFPLARGSATIVLIERGNLFAPRAVQLTCWRAILRSEERTMSAKSDGPAGPDLTQGVAVEQLRRVKSSKVMSAKKP